MLERTSRIIGLKKIKQKSSNLFSQAIEDRLQSYPSFLTRTITYDNGSENVEHLKTNKRLGTQSYFCNPYHRWEKGSVENAVGLVRRFLPKKTDFATVSHQQIKHIETLLNNRPRKCLDYKTPQRSLTQVLHLLVECGHTYTVYANSFGTVCKLSFATLSGALPTGANLYD